MLVKFYTTSQVANRKFTYLVSVTREVLRGFGLVLPMWKLESDQVTVYWSKVLLKVNERIKNKVNGIRNVP